MKLNRILLAMMLALSFSVSMTHAQTIAPAPTTPSSISLPPSHDELAKPAAKEDDDDDDEIVIIQSQPIGKREKVQITPAMFEALFKSVLAKVSKEYQDPHKLGNWSGWEAKYKGKLKTEEDFDAAVKEVLGSLNDRWTVYYSPSDIADQRKAAKDGYLSIGMLLRKHKDNAWHIDGMQFNTPAMLSTLREGDVIKSINGKTLEKATQGEVSKMLQGKIGDKVTVVAAYDGAEHSIELKFATQGPNEVAVGMLPGNIAYVRLPSFMSQEAMGNLVNGLGQLYQQSEGQINGLVFDLRYNSGGLVTMALDISSLFLENGTITTTTTRADRRVTDTAYKVIPVPAYLEARMPAMAAEFTHFLQTVPMVVLTNGSSASASEITTGALHDTGRALVIGTKTFGKAVGYTNTPMPNGGVLQVTNLSYLTPNGTNIADKGIEPNKVVEQPRGKPILSESDEQVKAAHEHLLKIAQERAKQLTDASDLSTKSHNNPGTARPAFYWHPIFVTFVTMSGITVLLLLGFVLSSRRKQRNKR